MTLSSPDQTDRALRLSPEERTMLAAALLDNLDDLENEPLCRNIEQIWGLEAAKSPKPCGDGRLENVSAEQILKKIKPVSG